MKKISKIVLGSFIGLTLMGASAGLTLVLTQPSASGGSVLTSQVVRETNKAEPTAEGSEAGTKLTITIPGEVPKEGGTQIPAETGTKLDVPAPVEVPKKVAPDTATVSETPKTEIQTPAEIPAPVTNEPTLSEPVKSIVSESDAKLQIISRVLKLLDVARQGSEVHTTLKTAIEDFVDSKIDKTKLAVAVEAFLKARIEDQLVRHNDRAMEAECLGFALKDEEKASITKLTELQESSTLGVDVIYGTMKVDTLKELLTSKGRNRHHRPRHGRSHGRGKRISFELPAEAHDFFSEMDSLFNFFG